MNASEMMYCLITGGKIKTILCNFTDDFYQKNKYFFLSDGTISQSRKYKCRELFTV